MCHCRMQRPWCWWDSTTGQKLHWIHQFVTILKNLDAPICLDTPPYIWMPPYVQMPPSIWMPSVHWDAPQGIKVSLVYSAHRLEAGTGVSDLGGVCMSPYVWMPLHTFRCPPYIWMPPYLQTPPYGWMPYAFGCPLVHSDAPNMFRCPICLDTPSMSKCPHTSVCLHAPLHTCMFLGCICRWYGDG